MCIKLNFIIFCIFKLCAIVQANLNLEIVESINGSAKKVMSTLIEEPAGSNITLFCKVMNLQSSATVNTNLSWFKIPKSADSIRQYKISNNKVYLEINELSSLNEGLYACVSLKFSVFKDIYVRTINYTVDRRYTQRSIDSLLRLKSLKLKVRRNEDLQSISDRTQKSLDDYFKNVNYRSYNFNYNVWYNHNFNLANEGWDTPINPFSLLLGGFVLFFIIMVALIRCYNKSKNACPNSLINGDIPSTCFERANYDGNDLNEGSLLASHEEVSTTNSDGIDGRRSNDLPPSYFTCVDNYGINENRPTNEISLLPSYEEALAMLPI